MKTRYYYLKLLSFIILSTISSFGFSQSDIYKLDNLTGKTWIMQGLNDKTSSDVYEDSQIKWNFNGAEIGVRIALFRVAPGIYTHRNAT